jgi:hypothetical protein
MKYNVLEDFELPGGKSEPVKVEAGAVWIPADTGVPKYEVERLERDGKIELIVSASADESGEDKPKRRRRH